MCQKWQQCRCQMGQKHEQSDDQTGCKQTPRLAKLIWKRKPRETVQLLPKLSIVHIHHSLQTCSLNTGRKQRADFLLQRSILRNHNITQLNLTLNFSELYILSLHSTLYCIYKTGGKKCVFTGTESFSTNRNQSDGRLDHHYPFSRLQFGL